jgi:hypothetical protein
MLDPTPPFTYVCSRINLSPLSRSIFEQLIPGTNFPEIRTRNGRSSGTNRLADTLSEREINWSAHYTIVSFEIGREYTYTTGRKFSVPSDVIQYHSYFKTD